MKKLLGDLAALSSRIRDAERRIHDRAMERDGEVSSKLDKLRPQAMMAEEIGKEYRTLVLERAKLAQVIGLARHRIAA